MFCFDDCNSVAIVLGPEPFGVLKAARVVEAIVPIVFLGHGRSPNSGSSPFVSRSTDLLKASCRRCLPYTLQTPVTLMAAFHPLRTSRGGVVTNLMDFRRIQLLLWGKGAPPSRRTWGRMGCGGLTLGLLSLFFLRSVAATGATDYYGAWALVILGGAILIAIPTTWLWRS